MHKMTRPSNNPRRLFALCARVLAIIKSLQRFNFTQLSLLTFMTFHATYGTHTRPCKCRLKTKSTRFTDAHDTNKDFPFGSVFNNRSPYRGLQMSINQAPYAMASQCYKRLRRECYNYRHPIARFQANVLYIRRVLLCLKKIH